MTIILKLTNFSRCETLSFIFILLASASLFRDISFSSCLSLSFIIISNLRLLSSSNSNFRWYCKKKFKYYLQNIWKGIQKFLFIFFFFWIPSKWTTFTKCILLTLIMQSTNMWTLFISLRASSWNTRVTD